MDRQTPAVAARVGSAVRTDVPADCRVTAFVCVNCARAGVVPTSGERARPSPVTNAWSFRVNEVMVPCTGKLQPEHMLKAFEAGADLVCVLACAHDNCHYLQGCRRAERRVEYVKDLLDQVGLGGERLLMFRLPGSAVEDMALARAGTGMGTGGTAAREAALGGQVTEIGKDIAGTLRTLGTSPLRRNGV